MPRACVKLEKVKEIAVGLPAFSDPHGSGHHEARNPNREESLIERPRKKIEARDDKQNAKEIRDLKARHLEFFLKAGTYFRNSKVHE